MTLPLLPPHRTVNINPLLICRIFTQPVAYTTSLQAMQAFTATRQANTPDEIWLLEHADVLTLGVNAHQGHILHPNPPIPVVQSDRGGQVTWHGKGQLVGYCMLDLKRLNWHVRDLVSFGETLIIQVLEHFDLSGYADPDAPGVYIEKRKIASIGFKIKAQQYSYHGFSINVDNLFDGFGLINPCGFAQLTMTNIQQEYARMHPSAQPPIHTLTVSDLICQQLPNIMQSKTS